jgi:hypothetical protein
MKGSRVAQQLLLLLLLLLLFETVMPGHRLRCTLTPPPPR